MTRQDILDFLTCVWIPWDKPDAKGVPHTFSRRDFRYDYIRVYETHCEGILEADNYSDLGSISTFTFEEIYTILASDPKTNFRDIMSWAILKEARKND